MEKHLMKNVLNVKILSQSGFRFSSIELMPRLNIKCAYIRHKKL